MTQIILDASVSGQLHKLTQPVELCDPSGRVLGEFVPRIDMSEWEPVSPDVSEEELDRREQSKDWYTTEQVLAHLKGLENQYEPIEPHISSEELQQRRQEPDFGTVEVKDYLEKLIR